MNNTELKVARMRRKITGREAGAILGKTVDGYFKKEHGEARFTPEEAMVLTLHFGLTFTEFIQIFFDGELPFVYAERESCDFRQAAKPLKTARLVAGVSIEDAAAAIGISLAAYKARDNGNVRCTLEQCRTLSKLFGLTFQAFNDIFFRSNLPYRKEDILAYDTIIQRSGGEINA